MKFASILSTLASIAAAIASSLRDTSLGLSSAFDPDAEPCTQQSDAIESCYGGSDSLDLESCLLCAHGWMANLGKNPSCADLVDFAADGRSGCVEGGQCSSECDAQVEALNTCALALVVCTSEDGKVRVTSTDII